MRPPRKVPTVSTTARAWIVVPSIVTTPSARPFAHHEVGDFGFAQREVRLRLEQRADRLPIQRAVRLRAGRAHGRALARVQRAELDAGAVGGDRHRAAHGVDLAHQVALADAADRRVAAHLADGREALRHQQRARAHPGRREGRLGAGVAAADDDDVELFHEVRHDTSHEVTRSAFPPPRLLRRVRPRRAALAAGARRQSP